MVPDGKEDEQHRQLCKVELRDENASRYSTSLGVAAVVLVGLSYALDSAV